MNENGRQGQYNLSVYIYVIGIGDKSLPIHSNKNTGKVTTPVHWENRQVKNFNLQILE